MTPSAIRKFYSALRAANPEPRTELVYATPYQLLVAVILSAQATDRSVNAVTTELFSVAPDAHAMVQLGAARLKRHIRTIGLFNSKARHILAASQLLLAQHAGLVPAERTALEALPGVGRKTANVVLNTVWGDPVIAVDTHVFRVSNRLPLAAGATPLAVELGLEAAVPAEFKRDALVMQGDLLLDRPFDDIRANADGAASHFALADPKPLFHHLDRVGIRHRIARDAGARGAHAG